MSYILKQSKLARGLYLQIYETTYDKETKKSNNKCYETWGYYEDLKKEYEDPIATIKQKINELNEGITTRDIGATKKYITGDDIYNFGYIVVLQLFKTIKLKEKWINRNFDEQMYDYLINEFIYYRFSNKLVLQQKNTIKEKIILADYIDNKLIKISSFFNELAKVNNNPTLYKNIVNSPICAVYNNDIELLYFKELTQKEKDKLILIETPNNFKELKESYALNQNVLFITKKTKLILDFIKNNNINYKEVDIWGKKALIFKNINYNSNVFNKISASINSKIYYPSYREGKNIYCVFDRIEKFIDKIPHLKFTSRRLNCIKISGHDYINITEINPEKQVLIIQKDFYLFQLNDHIFKKLLNSDFIAHIALENKQEK